METRTPALGADEDRNDGASATSAARRDEAAPTTTSVSERSTSATKPASNPESTNTNGNARSTEALDASNATTPPNSRPTTAARRPRGHRAASSVWGILTLDASPHLAIASVCRHCGTRVPHHHKSEKARAHLTRCTAFRKALADADARGDTEFPRPDWLPESSTRQRSRGSNDSPTSSEDTPSRVASNKRQRLTASTTATTSVSTPDPLAVFDALAMYVFTTGSPLTHVENPHLRRAIDLAASSSGPLLRGLGAQDLTGAALDRAFAAVQCELLRVTQRPGAVNALCVNSWVPPARESVYIVGSAHATPLFIDGAPTIDDPAAAASAHVLFDRLARALTLCGDNIHGVVTDNSHANQLTWAKFKSIFPAKFFHGCAAHGLYLFVDEIFGETTEGTPFADLRRLARECRELVEFFSSDQVPPDVHASISAKLSDARAGKLAMPPPGQWFDLKGGFESVLVVLPVLQELTAAAAFLESGNKEQRQRIAAVVSQSDLETLLFKAVALVDPLDTLMRRLEHNPLTPISDVFYWFAKELPVALSRVPGLSEEEATFLLKLNQNRFNAMYGDSHGMAYLLDPRYVGEGLSADVRKNIEDLIFHAPLVEAATKDVNSDEQKIQIAQQLTEYVIDATKEKTENSFRYSMLAKNRKTVLQYWQSDGLRWPLLQRLATRLFALPASTLPMTKEVLRVPLQLPKEDLTPAVLKKIKFIQLNQALLESSTATTESAKQ